MDAGVWRYHPTRHVFEVFTEGGSNPWGIDFDEHGQIWAEMCVIPHLWHMIQGARIERQGGEHFTVGPEETARYSKGRGKPVHPHIYEDIKQHGDHVHWAGQLGPHAANSRSDSRRRPRSCRRDVLSRRLLARRISRETLPRQHPRPTREHGHPERLGSSYVGHHGKDFLNFTIHGRRR